jgi:hypothetical protein
VTEPELDDEPVTLDDALHTISVLKKKIGKQDQELKDKVVRLELELQRVRSEHGRCATRWQLEQELAQEVVHHLRWKYELEE